MATLDNDDMKAMRDLFELVLEEKEVVTKKDLEYLPSKEEFYSENDKLMKELKAIREEHPVLSNKVSEHSDELEKLKKIHPDYRHQSPS